VVTDLLARLNAALADRYIVDRELGRGGNGVVYLARDRKHGRAVAIKVISPDLTAAVDTERFLREIQIAARLTPPHILPLHDSGTADGLLFYLMPYAEGESLRRRLQRERQLPLPDALRITREVASALSYAHQHDILHRDIKPDNILLVAQQAVVADFGLARAISSAGTTKLTQTGVAVGTPTYMSPEQARGSRDLDGRSDLYTLACVTYEMLVGRPPFVAESPLEVRAQHLHDPMPTLRAARADVPEAVERAVRKALATSPADRFATVAEYAAALSNESAASSPVRRSGDVRSLWHTLRRALERARRLAHIG
jgi:serine/threonine-protein kinase